MKVDFDGRSVDFTLEELEDVVLAYATTIHKSQGSEYPAVIVVQSNRVRSLFFAFLSHQLYSP